MFHACVHALIAALSHFCRPLTRLCVINKDKQKNPVGTTQETQFNTSIQHAAARASSHATAADVLGQSGEGWRRHGGALKGTVNKELVQSERLYCQNRALRCVCTSGLCLSRLRRDCERSSADAAPDKYTNKTLRVMARTRRAEEGR